MSFILLYLQDWQAKFQSAFFFFGEKWRRRKAAVVDKWSISFLKRKKKRAKKLWGEFNFNSQKNTYANYQTV